MRAFDVCLFCFCVLTELHLPHGRSSALRQLYAMRFVRLLPVAGARDALQLPVRRVHVLPAAVGHRRHLPCNLVGDTQEVS